MMSNSTIHFMVKFICFKETNVKCKQFVSLLTILWSSPANSSPSLAHGLLQISLNFALIFFYPFFAQIGAWTAPPPPHSKFWSCVLRGLLSQGKRRQANESFPHSKSSSLCKTSEKQVSLCPHLCRLAKRKKIEAARQSRTPVAIMKTRDTSWPCVLFILNV